MQRRCRWLPRELEAHRLAHRPAVFEPGPDHKVVLLGLAGEVAVDDLRHGRLSLMARSCSRRKTGRTSFSMKASYSRSLRCPSGTATAPEQGDLVHEREDVAQREPLTTRLPQKAAAAPDVAADTSVQDVLPVRCESPSEQAAWSANLVVASSSAGSHLFAAERGAGAAPSPGSRHHGPSSPALRTHPGSRSRSPCRSPQILLTYLRVSAAPPRSTG